MIPDLTDPAFWLAPLASAGFGLLIVVLLLARFTRYWTRRKQRILEQHEIDAAAAAIIKRAANDTIPMRSSLKMKARHGQPGEVRPHLEHSEEVVWSHDRHRYERRRMRVDREHDFYRQEWVDLDTGEVAWAKEGRLSDPDLHGESARRRR